MRKTWVAALVAASMLAACTSDDEATETTSVTTSVAPTVPATLPADTAPADTEPVATDPDDTEPPETVPADTEPASTDPPDTEAPDTTAPPTTEAPEDDALLAGAGSRSVLPTVAGTHAFLLDAPGWDGFDPNDPGAFVAEWDQGRVDVGNGDSDGSWVHDDIRASALAIQRGDDLLVMVAADVYMVFAVDAAEIERRARAMLPAEVAESAQIIISATHNHHGPDTAFSVNDDWYDFMADEVAGAIDDAVDALEPATLAVSSGEHRFGVSDGRDPIIIDTALKVMTVTSTETDDRIATVVQWGSHPETTLGWTPSWDITEQCAVKGWEGEDCTANGRYFTADYPGVLRDRLQAEVGGEVLYFNGSIGSQIGPGDADVWAVDGGHAVGNGWSVPNGAAGVGPAPVTDEQSPYRVESFARTEAIGTQLALAVQGVAAGAVPLEVDEILWREQPFFTRLTNIGFRVLLADGDLGWQVPTAFICEAKPLTEETCVSDEGRFVDDPVLTPLIESQIREGDVLQTRLVHVDLGDVGFLFMPGEIPPELTIGLPATFNEDPSPWYLEPQLHATGADYTLPGYLLELVDEPLTFTVGLGGDELGYWTPINEVRLKCLDLVMPADSGVTCESLFDMGYLVTPDAIGGPLCRTLYDDPAAPDLLDLSIDSPEYAALVATCRYGQALGRELGEPEGHYEETNSAGWDLVDDLFAAAEDLLGREATSAGTNPDNPGYTPMNPPPSG